MKTSKYRIGVQNEADPRVPRTSVEDTSIPTTRTPAYRWQDHISGMVMEHGKLSLRCQARNSIGSPKRVRVAKRSTVADCIVVAEAVVMKVEPSVQPILNETIYQRVIG